MLRRHAFVLVLGCLPLQACWVPQVIQGVRPQLFSSASPPPSQIASVTLEGKIITLGTRLITIAKRTSGLLQLSANLAAHRQALENHLYYNVKASGDFSGWGFNQGSYSYYEPFSGSRYSLRLLNAQDGQPDFDALGLGSYGHEPLPAKSFPSGVYRYRLESQLPDSVAGDTLKMNLTGQWPVQIPLRESFVTTLKGTGSDTGHQAFGDLSLQIDGKSLSDSSLIEGQIGFSVSIEGKIYNGFGTVDARGFVSKVNIEQNGVPVAQIVPHDKRWDVEVNGRVAASGE